MNFDEMLLRGAGMCA